MFLSETMENLLKTVLQVRASMSVLQKQRLSDKLEHQQQVRRLTQKVKILERQRSSSSTSRSSKIKSVIITLPCLLGCLYQAYRITDVYLKYDVTAEALFYPGDPIVPPMVTFCINNDFWSLCNNRCQRNSTQTFKVIPEFEEIARFRQY